ncbi:MAG: adenosylcobalamin-dependent ribonucleoside-diphosphate reductase, partial [Dehalococcoidia bacterium]
MTTVNSKPKVYAPVAVSDNARVVLERRYLAKDEAGQVIETPEELFARVAHNVAQAELLYQPLEDADAVARWEERFYRVMADLSFMPNSPTLMNAGRELQQLSACFVLPVADSIDGIFESVKHTALIHKSGGGTGFAFSRVRPEGDRVKSTMGVASGPVSFLKIFDCATEQIKQGGTRRGANMGILAVDHPDIEKFIAMKGDMVTLTNFNISVAATEQFMEAVAKGEELELVNPRTGQVVARKDARQMFDTMVQNAWRNGDPGLIFIDRINGSESNPVPKYGRIEATNPCGEEPLFPYESCNLGSINLAKFVRRGNSRIAPANQIDWQRLGQVVTTCVRFLDNVIDMNRYPIPQIEEMSKKMRRIGLGVMGFADLLFQLRIPYDSEEGLKLGEEVMAFIQRTANEASLRLAEERGVYPAWEDSIHKEVGAHGHAPLRYRNCNRTVIAPTGTISIIADCSSGIEPLFALAFTRTHYLDAKDPSAGTQLIEVNEAFQRVAKEEGFYSDELIEYLAEGSHLAERPEVPEWVKKVFVTAHDITPEWHVRMQAAFQRHTDNA